ncbi:MAG: GxxExxY protein [Tepidisphaeraceae bacterium]
MNSEEINTFFDVDEEPDARLRSLTNRIIGCAIRVHRALGPGYLESYYETALQIEFERSGIAFVRQYPFEVRYEGQLVGEGRLDFLIEDLVIVELKHVESIASIHVAQALSYLKATNKRLALIINFNVPLLKNGIKRIAR